MEKRRRTPPPLPPPPSQYVLLLFARVLAAVVGKGVVAGGAKHGKDPAWFAPADVAGKR